MNPIAGTLRRSALGAMIALIVSLVFPGSAWALYPPDGAKQVNGAGPYFNPDDGICVIGLSATGTMLVDWSIGNARDCVAYTTGLTGMAGADVTATYGTAATCCTTGSTGCSNANNVAGALYWSALGQKCYDTSACTIAGARNSLCTALGAPWTCCSGAGAGSCMETNDNYKHAWSGSVCVSPGGGGISRVDLDNTDAMCISKGGTVAYAGKCVAYGWQYLNRKPDGTLPVTGSGVSTTPGPAIGDGLGFCSATIRMTGGTYTATNCPSNYNSATYSSLCTAAGVPFACCTGSGAGSTCVGFNNVCTAADTPLDCCTGAGTGTCSWTTGPTCLSSTNGCQTQEQYDAGLGWTYSSSSGGCRYQYAVAGPLGGATAKVDGTVQAAAAVVDLTTAAYDTMGECLASGFTWDNWLPVTGTSLKTNASGVDYARMPASATIRHLDAISTIEDGGGAFYSGTGAVCLKCHSDMSRSYMERNKPGYFETRHKGAGDATGKPFQQHFDNDPLGPTPSPWGLKGVQCAMCHSTAKPAQDDLLQVNPAGATNEGLPKSATGHNNTEYGTHLIDLCYSCHGTAATPATINPATVIPSTTTDFTLTNKGLAPIANQFLNSPHARYTGMSNKVDVGNKNLYTSPFEGYVCRSAAGNLNRSYSSSTACGNAGYTWYTTANYGNICYYTPPVSSCTAAGVPAACCTGPGTGPTCNGSCGGTLNPTGVWTNSFTSQAYPWAKDTGGPGGVCYGLGLGSIITTVYRNGAAERIHNLDSTINTACTNPGNGSATSGADGWWLRDGETSPGTPNTTDQGNCMTCHDVHWALASTDPEAEPLRRECTTCHVNTGASASLAPQIDPTRINHLSGAGSPLANLGTDPDESCEFCHMPKSSATGSPMHLWRINTQSTYTTMGAAQTNTAADGTYASASWVDIDHACGQCHYTNGVIRTSTIPAPTWPLFTRGQLALRAKGIHQIVAPPSQAPVATQTCTSAFDASSLCTAVGTPFACCTGVGVGPCTGDDTWTMRVTDTSTNQSNCTAAGVPYACCTGPGAGTCANIAQETVNWGDGSVVTQDTIAPFGPWTKTYIGPGSYPILHTVIDNAGRVSSSALNCTANWTYFTISGTVTTADTTTQSSLCTAAGAPWACCTGPGLGATCDTDSVPRSGVTVTVTNAATAVVVGTTQTSAAGTYSVPLNPGRYTVAFDRAGYSFPAPTTWVIGPSQTVNGTATPDRSRVRVIAPGDPKDLKNPGRLGTGPRVR